MLSAAISAANTVALSGYELDLSFLSNHSVILLIAVFLSFYSILFFIRLLNH